MRGHWKICACCLIALVTIGYVPAPDLPSIRPAPDAHVVRVQIGYAGGMCGGFGYCSSSITVEPTFIVSELTGSTDQKRLPDTKTKRAITKKEWEELQRSIDAIALKALPQEQGCLPCRDLPDTGLSVEYSNGERITVSYDPANPPAPIAALLRKIPPNRIKLRL